MWTSVYTFLLETILLSSFVQCQTSSEYGWDSTKTLRIGYVLFPGFEPLDVFGPLEILYQASIVYNITLSTISFAKGPVTARPPPHRMDPTGPIENYDYVLGPSVIATHSFTDAPPLDVIIVPGGTGNFVLEQANDTTMETFLTKRFDETNYILSVCTGAVTLARAGVLAGRKATTSKYAWTWTTDSNHGRNITWVPSARWVQDGKVWTSSGVSAGIDMTYAFLKYLYGGSKMDEIINVIEYAPHVDAHWDPFSVVFQVPGADTSRSLVDCVVPVGNISQT